MLAQLTVPRQVGVSLVSESGKSLGWIVPPSRRSTLQTGWDGRIGGRHVPDGDYLVRLVYRSAVLATAPLHLDTHPPDLAGLRGDNGSSTRFAGDGPLLTTISPNGDGFRDKAQIIFRLREAATVTMDVTRTVKAPSVVYTITQHLGPGRHIFTWAPAANTNPRTFLVRLTAVDTAGNKIVYGAPDAFVGPVSEERRRARPGDRRRIRPAELRTRAGGPDPRGDRRAVARPAHVPLGARAGGHVRGQPVRRRRRRPGADPSRLDEVAELSSTRSRFQIPDVPSGLYYLQFTGAGRTRRLRAVRRSSGDPRSDRPHPGHPPHQHLGGLQLPGRRRQRLRRHLVRRPSERQGRPLAHLHRARRSAPLLPVRPSRSCTGCTGPGRARSSSRTPTST